VRPSLAERGIDEVRSGHMGAREWQRVGKAAAAGGQIVVLIDEELKGGLEPMAQSAVRQRQRGGLLLRLQPALGLRVVVAHS
jgi:hypothetical protein